MRYLSLAAVLATLGCSVSVDDGEATSGSGPETGEGGAGTSSSSSISTSSSASVGAGGSAPVCEAGCLALDFARQFDNVDPYALAVDTDGNILVTGGFDGTVDLGGGPLVSTGNIDAFVLKLDPLGNHLWSRRFGDLSSVIETQIGMAIAADASGNIAVGGRFGGTTDFGGGPLTNGWNSSGFVVLLDASGQHLWSKHFGDESVAVRSVGFHPAGGVVVAGDYARNVDFGGGPLPSVTTPTAFVARLDASGGHLWSRGFGGPGGSSAETLALDAAGNIAVGGSFHHSIDFGGGPLYVAGPSGPNAPSDIFVASLGPDGEHRWSQRLGGVDGDDHVATVVDGAGGVVTLGSFFTTFSVGGTTLTGDGSSVSVTRLSADGSAMFARSSARAEALATDAAGNTWLTGTFLEGTDLGCGTLPTKRVGIFVAGLDPRGDDFCNVAFEPSEYGEDGALSQIALDPTGALVAVGKFKGTIDFGAGPISSPRATESMILVKLIR
ncbi:hypothetical protein WME79_19450 [Sorangium sp. So ce726]|uniref:hypothetical protein n=1 Tax=Sorangium sp. So ce726 TaxID=3133319 RepID=UPI003F631F05